MTLLPLPMRPKFLLVRRDNIGDLVCTTPAIAALRNTYPSAEIAVLVNSYNAEVLRGNPSVNHVFVYQKLKHVRGFIRRCKAIAERIMLIARLRRWNPDVTILARASYERHGLFFSRLIGARNVIGFVPSDAQSAKFLPDIKLRPPKFVEVHEVEAINLLLKPLGIKNALGKLQVFPDFETVEKLKTNLAEGFKYKVGIHISAREPNRRWGADNFAELIQYILEARDDSLIILFWSPGNYDNLQHPGDDCDANHIFNKIKSSRLIPMSTCSLTELIAGLSLCDIFIGADGGAMHLAASLDLKVLGLFENSSEKTKHWYPWRATHSIVYSANSANPNINHIKKEQVQRAFEMLLSNT